MKKRHSEIKQLIERGAFGWKLRRSPKYPTVCLLEHKGTVSLAIVKRKSLDAIHFVTLNRGEAKAVAFILKEFSGDPGIFELPPKRRAGKARAK